jgi:glutamyl-Q tRNA(Asp) synthetase
VAALGSWLDARANQGKWLVRIEDIDTPRCIAGADLEIMRQLQAYGLVWDEEVSWQSKHIERYQRALERLNTLNLIYPCTCSRQTILEVLTAKGVSPGRNQEVVYPGTCRPLEMGVTQKDMGLITHVAWRLALPPNLAMEFDDLIMGHQSQNLSHDVGDFVLRRRDGLFTYQLAVVIDDAEQDITHVVRGQDLLSNTARQMYLQQILGYRHPQYLHLPLVLDVNGEKLSKQTLATAIPIEDPKAVLAQLRQAAIHLGLKNLPDGENISISQWLLSATQAWKSSAIFS